MNRLACVIALLIGSVAMAQETKKAPPPDLMERIKAAGLADKPFTLFVKVKIKDGTKEKFEEQAAKTAALSLKEKGCMAYELHANSEGANEYTLFEKWASLAALQEHMKQDYTQAILKMFGEVSAAPVEVLLYAPAKK